MDSACVDRLTRITMSCGTRRALLAMVGLAGGAQRSGIAKRKKRRKKRCATCCRPGGSTCRKGTKACKPKFCLGAPVTIEAAWSKPGTDHETYLFVPNAAGASLDAPHISDICNPDRSACEEDRYPYACVNRNADGPGGEVTTIRRLLPGTYEYWISVYTDSPAGDLAVTLRDQNGRIVRTWVAPPTGSIDELSWHVFDLDGSTGRVTSLDRAIGTGNLPFDAHDPAVRVCPED
jgi:hypothetical protein